MKEDVKWALESVACRREAYDSFSDYYDGLHPLLFATEKFRNAFGNLFQSLCDNLCPTVVEAMADRLNVTGFDGTLSKEAEDAWQEKRLRRASNQVHRAAAKYGDAFVLAWPDGDGVPQVWPQKSQQCAVRYDLDEPGKEELGAKVWMTADEYVRCTLYYPDHIERYITKRHVKQGMPKTADAFEPFSGDDAGPEVANEWDVVPLFHFANCDELGEYGRSELADVIPLQNALNKALCDMLVAMEFQAFPQRWATGLQIEIDPETGKPVSQPFTPGADRVWTGGKDVSFGQFQPSDLKSYLDVQKSIREEIARVSGVPLHYLNLSSQYPSGEAMKITESRLVKKTEDRQVNWGDVWSEVVVLNLRQGGATIDDSTELKLLWKSAAPYNPMLDAETQLIKEQVGVSMKQSLRELGYTDDQITLIIKENEEAMQSAAKAAAATFVRNGQPGQASTPAPQQQNGLKDSTTATPVTPERPKVPDRVAYSDA